MLEFFRIVQNEWIKLFRRRRFLVVLLLGLAMVGLFTYAQYHNVKNQERYASKEFQQQMIQQNIAGMEANLKDNPKLPADQKAGMEQEIKNQKDHLAKLDSLTSTEPVFDKQVLLKQIAETQKNIDQLPAQEKWQADTLELDKKILEYKLAHQLPSPDNNSPLPHYTTSGWHGIRDFLTIGPAIFIPLLSVLLVADIVSGEQTGGTIKLLLIRPASRTKILFAKYITSVSANLLVNILLFGLLTVSMLLVLGTKHGDDPTAVGVRTHLQTIVQGGGVQNMTVTDASHATIISMQSYAINGMLLTLLATVAMCTLGFFCSVLVRSAAVSTGLSMGIVIIGTILLSIGRTLTWKKYIITSDFNLPQAWAGGSIGDLSSGATLSESLLVLLVWTVVMYMAGHFLFRRRDILG
ncbi:MAG: ABC transporter permease [Tumebacillaceae bacterium]